METQAINEPQTEWSNVTLQVSMRVKARIRTCAQTMKDFDEDPIWNANLYSSAVNEINAAIFRGDAFVEARTGIFDLRNDIKIGVISNRKNPTTYEQTAKIQFAVQVVAHRSDVGVRNEVGEEMKRVPEDDGKTVRTLQTIYLLTYM